MFTIWIIDTSENTAKYSSLFGQFSISFYASLESAIKVSRMLGFKQPDALFLSCSSKINTAKNFFSDSLMILTGDKDAIHDSILYLKEINADLGHLICKSIKGQISKNDSFNVCLKELKLIISDQDLAMALSHKEALILQSLKTARNEGVSREDLSSILWGDVKVGARTLDAHISRLRKRIKPHGINIESSYGQGYRVALDF